MAIDLFQEKQRTLSTQDIYDILHFAAQSAEDNGFVNSFVFTRAIYAYAAIVFYPDRKEELAAKISNDLLGSWDELVEDGTVDKMIEDHAIDIDMLGNTGKAWLEEYTEYAQSARGLLDSLQFMADDIVSSAVNRFSAVAKDENAKEIVEIANKWGMNNKKTEDDKIKDKAEKLQEKQKDVNNLIKEGFELIQNAKQEEVSEDNADDYPLFNN